MAEERQTQSRAKTHDVLRWFEPHIAKGELKKLPLELNASLITGGARLRAVVTVGASEGGYQEVSEVFAEAARSAVRP